MLQPTQSSLSTHGILITSFFRRHPFHVLFRPGVLCLTLYPTLYLILYLSL